MPFKPKKLDPLALLKQKRDASNLPDRMSEELKHVGVREFMPVEMEGGSLNIDTEYLALPRDLTEIPSGDLGNYLNAHTQQKMYLRTLIGWQEGLVEEKRRTYQQKANEVYKTLPQKGSETMKERYVESDEDVIPLSDDYHDAKYKLDLLESNLSSIEDAIFLISREVTRRAGDFNTETRNHNVNSTRRK